jgi:hypothetical protein
MATQDEDDEQKVKDAVLDAATREQLERWFQLPSFTELEDRGVEIDDPGWAESRKKRAEALAAVDPAMLDWHRARNEREDLLQFSPTIELYIDREIGSLDTELIDARVAEPRERMLPFQLEQDLRDCTPQALLRDLHRPEMYFEKVFELWDVTAEMRVDVKAVIAEAMTTRWTAELREPPAIEQTRAMLREVVAFRRRPWVEVFAAEKLPNRVVSE